MREIKSGTLCTTFDMCEVGKLMAPGALHRLQGNNFLRKRTTVYTTSQMFHASFDHRYCRKEHEHDRIEGKVLHLGRWISRSEYAARYSSGFGRNVARYLASSVRDQPVLWNELLIDGVNTDEVLAADVIRRRNRSEDEDVNDHESLSGSAPFKRRRLIGKQPEFGSDGAVSTDFWQDVFRQVGEHVPRVGKRVFVDEPLLHRIQAGVTSMKVRRVEACRGTERFRLPERGLDVSEIPLRLTVVQSRSDGSIQVMGGPEEWTRLSKRNQIRKSLPASVSLTIFGQATVPGSEPAGTGAASGEATGGLEIGLPEAERDLSGAPPRNVPRHGPGFLDAPPEIKAHVRKLHHNLGHPDPQKYLQFLRERGSGDEVLKAARDFQCDSCLESQKGATKAIPGHIHGDIGFNNTIGMDSATWTSKTGQMYTFLHVVDEGTLFQTAAPSAQDVDSLIQTFQRIWLMWAGPPRTVYLDPASAYNSDQWQAKMQELDVRVKMIVAEAHWQLGRAEAHGAVLKRMLSRMDHEMPIRTSAEFERALMMACSAKNSLSRAKGFSPEQAVLGISSHLPASITSCDELGSHALVESSGEAADRCREAMKVRTLARKAFIDADNSSSLRRAMLRRTRPMRGPFEVGDWLLYWRQKGANMRRTRGQWHGPACVVAVEGHRNVWLNHSGKLVRASPEQVRPASFREWKAVTDAEQRLRLEKPKWNLPISSGAFLDLESEPVPTSEDDDYEPSVPTVQEPESEASQMSEGPEAAGDASARDAEVDPADVPVSDADWSAPPDSDSEDILFGDDVDFEAPTLFGSFEHDMSRVWEVDISPGTTIPDGLSGDEMVLTASEARKKKVKVKVSTLSAADQLRFAQAKHKEIGAWLKHGTVRKASHGRVPEHAIMRCRWLLSWKPVNSSEPTPDSANGFKAKARLVVVGFEDPSIGELASDAPTLTKDGRQLVVQMVASRKWELLSFDVSTAFLRGDSDGRLLGLHPPPELAEALQMAPGDQCELLKGAYGRVDAPFLWFKKFRDTLLELGFRQCPLDPCVFLLSSGKEKDVVVHGTLGIHVDDGIGGGDSVFRAKLEEVRGKFDFGSFETGEFTYTGIRFKQWDDFSIEYGQQEYIEKISPITIKPDRRRFPEASLTPAEVSDLRSLVGSLQYAAVHTRPDLCAKVGELQSGVTKGTVQLLLNANKVLHEAKTHPVTLMALPINAEQVTYCAFSDASFLSGTEKFAHQGALIFATTSEMLENQRAVVSPVAWISKKIHRVIRSTLGAESVALSGAIDRLLWIRIFWAWLKNPLTEWRNPEEALEKERKAALVTDCKSAYDLLTRVAVPQCEEHRTTIACLLIRERLQANCMVRWVTSGAQLADCLTKSMDASVLRECLKSGKYALFDESRVLQARSDKRHKQKWLQTATGAQETCLLSEVQDFWDTSQPGLVVRVHQIPRTRLFAPIGVLDCPCALGELCLERETCGKTESGRVWRHTDFWPGMTAFSEQPEAWVGKTIFKRKDLRPV